MADIGVRPPKKGIRRAQKIKHGPEKSDFSGRGSLLVRKNLPEQPDSDTPKGYITLADRIP